MTRDTRHPRLLRDLPRSLDEEQIDELLRTPSLRIERIVSTGHTNAFPPNRVTRNTRNGMTMVNPIVPMKFTRSTGARGTGLLDRSMPEQSGSGRPTHHQYSQAEI